MSPHTHPDEDRPSEEERSFKSFLLKLSVVLLILFTLVFENLHEADWVKKNHCIADKIPFYTATCELTGFHLANPDKFMTSTETPDFKGCKSHKYMIMDTGIALATCSFIVVGILLAFGVVKPSRMIGFLLVTFLFFWLYEIADLWLDYNQMESWMSNLILLLICSFIIWRFRND